MHVRLNMSKRVERSAGGPKDHFNGPLHLGRDETRRDEVTISRGSSGRAGAGRLGRRSRVANVLGPKVPKNESVKCNQT